jgi:NAD(P)-dependent dehydrogenase (short-subunit alcohol dehydrogenase family)
MRYSGKSLDEVIVQRIKASALKRLVDPKYIAAMVAFLCSDDVAVRTGEDINVTMGNIVY